ncbi:hypothetical protein [Haliovirga abyssi]|nr:hypothetical protein [Haliovirga abyssi]
MNKTIGEILIKNNKKGIKNEDVKFKLAKTYSPYIEVNNQDINRVPYKKIEVNPYYRFAGIFSEMLHPESKWVQERKEITEEILDYSIYFLGELDRDSGMYHETLLINLLIEELINGRWGEEIANKFKKLKRSEMQELAYNLYRYYSSYDNIYFFRKSVRDIIANSLIYKKEEENGYLLYIGSKWSEEKENKLELIKELFLSLKEKIEVYWEHHFGIIEEKTTLKIDRIALY